MARVPRLKFTLYLPVCYWRTDVRVDSAWVFHEVKLGWTAAWSNVYFLLGAHLHQEPNKSKSYLTAARTFFYFLLAHGCARSYACGELALHVWWKK